MSFAHEYGSRYDDGNVVGHLGRWGERYSQKSSVGEGPIYMNMNPYGWRISKNLQNLQNYSLFSNNK